MRNIYIYFLVFTVVALGFASPGRAQDKPVSGDAVTSAPKPVHVPNSSKRLPTTSSDTRA
jgi:hypothetical protein